MLAPVWVIVGVSAVTSVPNGTVTTTVCVASVIVPDTAGLAKLNAVIAFADDNGAGVGGASLPPPPQPVIIMSDTAASNLKYFIVLFFLQ